MPKGKRDVRAERLWLYPEEEESRARWLLLAALTRENPEGANHLIWAAPLYAGMLAQHGDMASAWSRAIIGPSLQGHLEEYLGPDGFVTYLFNGVKTKPGPVSLAIGRWALSNKLLQVQGYSCEALGQPKLIKGPFYWLGRYAARLMEEHPSNASDVVGTCQKCADNIGIESATGWRRKEKNSPYPEKPLLIFVPKFQSKKEFLAESLEKLEQYADAILSWTEANGGRIAEERHAEERHF